MTDSLIVDPQQWRAALERAVDLVRAGELDGAQAQVDAMNRWAHPNAPDEQSVAAAFQSAASAAGAEDDVAAFEWLWKKAFNYWYYWGSGATSGGEGTARGRYILEAEARYEREKQRLAARVQPPVSGSGQ
jgi:hypothetical protein